MTVLDLTPRAAGIGSLLSRCWQARKLALILARRDFFSRYRRTSLGVVWAVAMPLLQAGLLAVVFTRVARLPLPGNSFVFVYSGMAGWAFFSGALATASTSIVDGTTMASRIYFPRLVLPLVSVLSGGYLLIVNFVLALVVDVVTGGDLSVWMLLLPIAMLMALTVTVLTAAVLAALHVYFRDTKYIVQAMLLLAFYVTPAFYPLTRAPGKLRVLDEINPMTGVIELTRQALGGADPQWVHTVAVSCGWIVALAAIAAVLYQRYDRLFSDLM